MKFILIIFISISLLGCSDTSNSASKNDVFKQRGDWESSGGDGVLCFKDEATKNKNKDLLANPEDYKKIPKDQVTLKALEFYEFLSDDHKAEFTLWSELKSNEDHKVILGKVLDRIRTYSPVFVQKLDLVLEHIQVETWVPREKVLNVEDSTPYRDLESQCELIQLADRQTQSSEGYLPKAKVYFRADLFESLDEMNKAVLILHEALYLIARETNHENSDLVRLANVMLFSDEFEDGLSEIPYFSQQAKEIQAFFIKYFGDYIRFFIKEEFYLNPKDYSKIKYANNYTRSVSMIQMNYEMREYIVSCMKAFTPQGCKDRLMLGPDLLSIVNTEEKSFLFLMNYFFDAYGMLYTNSEQLYVLNFKDPQAQDDNIQFQLGSSCGHLEGFVCVQMGVDSLDLDENGLAVLEGEPAQKIQDHFKKEVWFKDFILPAMRYCKDIRYTLRNTGRPPQE